MPIDVLIEGFLFYKSAPQKKQTIVKLFDISEEDFTQALIILRERLQVGATRIVETESEIQLVTCPEMAPIIEAMRKNELKADIGKAGAETLAIILYRAPISRSEIDRIRGVNSSFILRNLLIRGLVERVQDKSAGGQKFTVTPALLSHLGVTHKHELPDFARISDKLEQFNTDFSNKEA
ncbi:MAG: SMC-Scp complex subunit ScpB [Candidatus Pacebacteria bacterium]|nr:SMC-Scp complex subunit ScpB [Candidatus Paceibacterota bacterium]